MKFRVKDKSRFGQAGDIRSTVFNRGQLFSADFHLFQSHSAAAGFLYLHSLISTALSSSGQCGFSLGVIVWP